MLNSSTLVGRLTKDPDLRYTANGTAVATFTLAVNRNFTNQNGEREADFINCVIWRKSAESFSTYTKKGTLVGIVGRIQTRNYENQHGQRVYVTEVFVTSFSLLESRSKNESKQQEQPQQESNNQIPSSSFNESANGSFSPQADPFSDGRPIDISDDDLPF
ncbi:single-stranded DNA-binding protein [Enterococcus sp. LX10]|uniref:single-stranded DNA-binding protein n=1 Tax=Enterococcus sp. LX10 TaxID=2920934 RepID=UPI00201F8A2C|nr:single-stranded DNA-binding protein [Enterococcus sp. LX10]